MRRTGLLLFLLIAAFSYLVLLHSERYDLCQSR